MGSSTVRLAATELGNAQPDQMESLRLKYGAENVMLVGLISVVVFCHTATSYWEEQLFKKMNFSQPFFMVWVMGVVYSALYLIVSNSSTKLALEYVSIPTQIVFKSCKLVAVMLGSYVVLGRTYSLFEYAVACALVGGMCLFTLGDMHGSSSTEGVSAADWKMIIGISILCGSLCCDSLLGNMQEKVQKSKACTETELMFVQSAFSTCFLLVFMAFSGELVEAVQAADKQVWMILIAWALINMLGILCILRIVGKFSAVTAVLTSFIRKLSSITISFTFFPKPLNVNHIVGVFLVFGAIAAHSYHKHSNKEHTVSDAELEERTPLSEMMVCKSPRDGMDAHRRVTPHLKTTEEIGEGQGDDMV